MPVEIGILILQNALRFKLRNPVLSERPLNPLRPQRPDCQRDRIQIPAAAAQGILSLVRREEIPPEKEAGNLVIKRQIVVADTDCARLGKPSENCPCKFVFRKPVFLTVLRQNAGQKTALRRREKIMIWPAVKDFSFAYEVQIFICSYPRELRGTSLVTPEAESFIVMPVKRVAHPSLPMSRFRPKLHQTAPGYTPVLPAGKPACR